MDPTAGYSWGTISNGLQHAWLFLSPEIVDETEEVHRTALIAMPGDIPRCAIAVEISRDPTGMPVALTAAQAFEALAESRDGGSKMKYSRCKSQRLRVGGLQR